MKGINFVFATLILACASSWADTVVMKNGDLISGTVDSISSGHVLLNTDYAGHVTIKLDAIAELTTEAAFDVTAAAGESNGQFVVADGVQMVQTDSGAQPIDVATVSSAGQNNLGLAAFAPEWSSRADLAATLSNGNTDTENYSALIESTFKKGNVEHGVRLQTVSEEVNEETTKDEFDLDYSYKRFLSEKWFAAGNAEYFENDIKNVDSRVTLGAGLGHQFWDNSFGSFSTDVGISYVDEEIDGEDESNPAVRWGLDYRRFLFSKKLEVFHSQSILFIPDSDRGEVLQSSSGLRFVLNSRIDAFTRIDVDHETEPAPDNSKTDVTYNVGVGVKF